MENIYKKIDEVQELGIAAALCTVIYSSGSTPRKAGSKMLVYADGSIFGTIGGGNFEHLVIKQALAALMNNESGIFEYELAKDAGMTCGGFAKVFIEALELRSKLYIFGAGHIGTFLADLAEKVNFQVTLIDDRKDFYEPSPHNTRRFINTDFSDALQVLDYDRNTFVSIATYQHKLDKLIAGYCAKKQLAYVGMVGSKAKIATLKKELIDEKVLTEAEFETINTPIGIGIACETPQEIAVSILAKLIDVRNTMPKLSAKKPIKQ